MKEKILLLLFLFLQLSAFAGEDDDLPPTDDPPLAPIDNWINLFLVLAVAYVAYYFFTKIKHQNKLS